MRARALGNGRYQVDGRTFRKGAQIAEGGFAVVHRLGDRYAIKSFKPDSNPANRRAELAHAARGLLIPVAVVAETDELVMPLARPLDTVALTRAQKTAAVDRVHALQLALIDEGFIYSDLKAQNVAVLPDGTIALSDYSGLCTIGGGGGGEWCINTVGLPEHDYALHPTIRTRAEAIAAAKYYSAALLVQLHGQLPVAMGHSQITDVPPRIRAGVNAHIREWLRQQGHAAQWLHPDPSRR